MAMADLENEMLAAKLPQNAEAIFAKPCPIKFGYLAKCCHPFDWKFWR
jgi:hypothetical protein